MEITARKPLIDAQRAFTRDYAAMLPLAQLRGILTRAGASNPIPTTNNYDVRLLTEAGKLIQDVFYVNDNDVFGVGNLGLTPFAKALNKQLGAVTWDTIQVHNQFLREVLPEDLYRELSRRSTAKAEVGVVAELDDPRKREFLERWAHLRIYDSRALNEYMPPHTALINGLRVSNRVWQIGNETRNLFNQAVYTGIQRRHSSETIANGLVQFLTPQARQQTTSTPYGRKGSFPARRLARTEISRQWGQTTITAGRLNPFVVQIDWRVSATHKGVDECDVNAGNGPYSVWEVPIYPAHPQCMCHLVQLVASNRAQIIDDIRQSLIEAQQLGIQPYVNPSNPMAMLSALLGPALASWVLRELGEFFFGGVQ